MCPTHTPRPQDVDTGPAGRTGQALVDLNICQSSARAYRALGGHRWRDSEAGAKGIESVG